MGFRAMKLIPPALRSFSRLASVVALMFLSTFLSAKTVVYPVEAIAELWQLGATDFQSKFGGINVTGLGLSDEGWYVRYQHENLTLLFGPLDDRETARRHAWELESVRDAAVKNRASLASSKVDFVRFTLSGRYGSRGDGSGGGEDEEGSASGRGADNAASRGAAGAGAGGSKSDGAQGGNGAEGGAAGQGSEGPGAGQSVADLRGAGSGRDGSGGRGQTPGQAQGQGQGEQGGLQPVASLGNGQQSGAGSSGVARGASGAAGSGSGQGAQAGQSGSAASGQSAGQGSGGGAGMPGSPGAPSSGQSGGGDPLSAVIGLFRRILGL